MTRQGHLIAGTAACAAAMMAFAAMVFTASSTTRHGLPIRHTRAETRHVSNPGSLIWPGSFQIIDSGPQFSVPFVAAGHRYLAQVASHGFVVATGKATDGSIELEFAGAASRAAQTYDPLSAFNLFTVRAGKPVSTQLFRYGAVGFASTYPGIDARYKVTDGELELDFTVNPGAKPESIDVRGSNGTRLEPDAATGDIIARRGAARYRIKRAVAYQIRDGQRTDVPVAMQTNGTELKFSLGDYDRRLPLTIDPLVAVYSTFVGTNTDAFYDNVASITTDAQGNVYLGGVTEFDFRTPTEVHGFPTTPASLAPQSPLTDPAGGPCVLKCGFVLKLDAQQHVVYGALVYGEPVSSIAIDPTGSAYAAGTANTGTNFLPLTSGTFSDGVNGSSFIFKLTPDGSHFVFNAAINGDTANGVAVDSLGASYVVGYSRLNHPPTTPGSLKPNYQDPGNGTSNQDGYLLKISSDGSTLVYGTYLGGSGTETANAVTVNASGEATVVGQAASTDFVGMPQPLGGPNDAYVVQLSADGSSMLHGRYFGGSGGENATGVASDNQGGYLACGATTSSDFPVTPGVLQRSLQGQRNGWVVRMDSGFNVIYSTYVGGSYIDGIEAIAADSTGEAYLAGVSFSSDLPLTSDGFQDISSDATNASLANAGSEFYMAPIDDLGEGYFGVLSASGVNLVYGTFLSGDHADPQETDELTTIAYTVAVSGSGVAYVGGETVAFDFPVTDGGLRSGLGAGNDGFLTKFENIGLHSLSPSLLPKGEIASPYSYQLQATGGTPPYQWSVATLQLPDGLALSSSGLISGSPIQAQTWSSGYHFTAKVVDAAGIVAYKSHFMQLDFQGNLLCTPNHCSVHSALVTPSLDPNFIYPVPNLARGVPPFTTTISGNSPPEFKLNADGTFSAVTATAGDFQFTMTIADAAGRAGVINWDINVPAASSAPTGTGSGGTTGGATGGGTGSTTGPSSASSKGGGGSLDCVALSLLLILAAIRRAPPGVTFSRGVS